MKKTRKRTLTIKGIGTRGVEFKITVEMKGSEVDDLDYAFDPFADRVGSLVLEKLAHIKNTEFQSDKKRSR